MEFKDIASVSGKGGLFRIVNPTRTGVILESLDREKKKLILGVNAKVSVLAEISIYTTDEKGNCPLEEVMKKIHSEFNGDTGLSGNSESDELRAFLRHVLPDFDEERVYVSDIKKLVNWYHILSREIPEILETKNLSDSEQDAV